MYNKCLLIAAIEQSGLKRKRIAAELGLTTQGLYLKILGENDFKASEISKLCALLALDSQKRDEIFFAQNGEDDSPYARTETFIDKPAV